MTAKIVGYYASGSEVKEERDRCHFPLNFQGISRALEVLAKNHRTKSFQYDGNSCYLIDGVLVGFHVTGEQQQSSLVFISEKENAGRLNRIIEEDLGLPRPNQLFYLS
ncbi:hypothetical protein J4233_01635 [Candidatus Pacearchaeota archaeon]|nr:hypothetical protein [Candidatus Pacearchaeota archaeon]